MHIKDPAVQLSLIMVGFLAYLSLPAFYWWWIKHSLVGNSYRMEDSMTIFFLLWFTAMVFIPAGLYFLVRTWRLARQEILSDRPYFPVCADQREDGLTL